MREENLKVTPFKEFMDKEQEATHGPISIGGVPERERNEITYEVSEEQMAFIKGARENPYPATYIVWGDKEYKGLFSGYEYTEEFERDLLKYIAGDEDVVFQLKEPLYRLVGKDADGDTVYFTQGLYPPSYTYDKEDAFTASREEITR